MGFLTNGELGTVACLVTNGLSSYASSTRFGITSTGFGAWAGSYAPLFLVPTFTNQPGRIRPCSAATRRWCGAGRSKNTFGYQWFHNGVLMPGETGATLIIPNVSAAASGSYAVQAHTASGTNASEYAQLVVLPSDMNTGVVTNPASGYDSREVLARFITSRSPAIPTPAAFGARASTRAIRICHARQFRRDSSAPGQSGNLSVVILPGQSSYFGSTRNGVTKPGLRGLVPVGCLHQLRECIPTVLHESDGREFHPARPIAWS